MRNLFTLFLMTSVMIGLSGCGKDNNSGGGNSGSSDPVEVSVSSPENFANYEQLREFYNNVSFSDNASGGAVVYHIGPYFTGEYYDSFSDYIDDYDWKDFLGLNFDFNACFSFGGSTSGDCGDNTLNSGLTRVESMIDNGEFKVIRSASKDEIKYDLGRGISQGKINYQSNTFSRNNQSNEIFRDMLNLDARALRQVVIKPAKVYVGKLVVDNYGRESVNNSKQLNCDYVEYFYNDTYGESKGFVICNNLPVLANPVAVVENNNLVGALKQISDTVITGLEMQAHSVQSQIFTGSDTTKAVAIGTLRFQL